MYEDDFLEMQYEDRWIDPDEEFEREVAMEVAARHAEEDRIEREMCEADPAYASEAPLRAMGG